MDRTLLPFLEKLLARTLLTAEEQDAVLSLARRPERLEARMNFVLLGDELTSSCFVLEGICARIEFPTEETRQITALYVAGDMPDLYSAFISQATAAVETLTASTIMRIPHAAIHKIMTAYPAIAEAFARYLVSDAAISQEWVANVGGRDAKAAVSHLYCEMAVRRSEVRGNEFSFHMPLTQTQVGEATGLSTVHINRTFSTLRSAGLLEIERSMVHVLDWNALQTAAGFDANYLVSKCPARIASYPVSGAVV